MCCFIVVFPMHTLTIQAYLTFQVQGRKKRKKVKTRLRKRRKGGRYSLTSLRRTSSPPRRRGGNLMPRRAQCHGSLQNPPDFSRFLQIFPRNSTHVNILDICMEYSGESISTVGLNQSPPSVEEVDMYKYPKGAHLYTKHSKC